MLETHSPRWLPVVLTVRLMDEVLPLDRPTGAERLRRHLFRVAEAHEAELASKPKSRAVDGANRGRIMHRQMVRCMSAWMAVIFAAG